MNCSSYVNSYTTLSIIYGSGTTHLEEKVFVPHYKDPQKYIVSGNYQAFSNDILYMNKTIFTFSALEPILVFKKILAK